MRQAPEIIAALTATNLTNEQLTLLLELVSVMSTVSSGLSSGLPTGSQVESPDDAIVRRRKYEREYKAKRRAAAKTLSTSVSTGLSTGQVDTSANDEEETNSKEVVEEKNTAASVVEGRKTKVARGSRLSADAPLTDEYRNAAIELGMHPDLVAGAWAEFVDYWAALPGQRGLKLNWLLTWRNRVRQLASKSPRNLQVIHGKAQSKPGVAEIARRYAEHFESQPGDSIEGGAGPFLRLSRQ